MLKLDGLHAHYGKSHVLQGVNLHVEAGEAVALLGRNGVGKTTTLRSIMGLTPPSAGAVTFDGARLDQMPAHKIAGLGIGYVPQGRRIFSSLNVIDNLCLGLTGAPEPGRLEEIFAQFPKLRERAKQEGGTLSGGEQQMLAIARCLIMKPKLLLLDEPTEGIMPKLVATLRNDIRAANQKGISILLIEQNFRVALALCTRVYIMEKGVISYEGTASEIRKNPEIAHRYLGVAVN
ncbi:MAG: ABC transporter ATP-binding protein [Alphaproteobacteria bacterium]|nr:ABC transporter ATP-binding protein [Alphaproteobacteria bacterium]MBM3733397.1 ABC transporter ATP-binding protein [Acidimicrobiia bacterium]